VKKECSGIERTIERGCDSPSFLTFFTPQPTRYIAVVSGLSFKWIPVHSPLLGESLLVSFPPLSDMLKFSGYSCLSRGRIWDDFFCCLERKKDTRGDWYIEKPKPVLFIRLLPLCLLSSCFFKTQQNQDLKTIFVFPCEPSKWCLPHEEEKTSFWICFCYLKQQNKQRVFIVDNKNKGLVWCISLTNSQVFPSYYF